MFKLLVILFVIKLYAREDIFKNESYDDDDDINDNDKTK